MKLYETKPIIIFFFNDTATTEIYTLSLHDALPIWPRFVVAPSARSTCTSLVQDSVSTKPWKIRCTIARSEEHTSELQSQSNLVCRLLLEKKKTNTIITCSTPPSNSTHHLSSYEHCT